jgi:photosystem II stability/assembly factor-like uncharacterized protein
LGRGRGIWILVGAVLSFAVVVGAAAWLYLSAPERQQEKPVATLAGSVVTAVAVRGGSAPTILVGTDSGLLTSEDLGVTWRRMLVPGGVRAIAAGGAPSPVFLAGQSLWRLEGQDLSRVPTELPTDAVKALAVDPSNAGRLFAVVSGRGLVVSADGGRTWHQIGSEAPADADALVMGGRMGPLFLATRQHGIFASADGRSWTNANGFVNGALPTRAIAALAYDPRSGDRYVAPNGQVSTGALYAGTDLGLFKSIDEGQSWSDLSLRRPIQAVAVSLEGPRLLVAVDVSGDVYRSLDGGNTWR